MKQAADYLKPFFNPIVRQAFSPFIELRDERVQEYIAGVLAGFCASDRLWSIRDADGRPIVRMEGLIDRADPVLGSAASFGEERNVRQYIGDYALFLAGVFPESVRSSRPRWVDQPGDPADIVKVGKESYLIVASFDEVENPGEAPLFKKLSRHFELCAGGLRRVAQEIR